jgi:hypothetical protein
VASSVSVDAGTPRANPIATVHIGQNAGRDAPLPPRQCKPKLARLLRTSVWANRRQAKGVLELINGNPVDPRMRGSTKGIAARVGWILPQASNSLSLSETAGLELGACRTC